MPIIFVWVCTSARNQGDIGEIGSRLGEHFDNVGIIVAIGASG